MTGFEPRPETVEKAMWHSFPASAGFIYGAPEFATREAAMRSFPLTPQRTEAA